MPRFTTGLMPGFCGAAAGIRVSGTPINRAARLRPLSSFFSVWVWLRFGGMP